MKKLRRTTTLGAMLLALASIGIFAAPAVQAQVGLPTTDGVTDVIDDTADTVTGTVGGAGDEVDETVEETVEDPGSLPDRVTDTVDDITEEVPDNPVTGPIKDVVNEVGNTVDESTGGTGTPPRPGKNGSIDGTREPRHNRDRDRSGSDRVLGTGTTDAPINAGILSPDGFAGALILDTTSGAPRVELEPAGPSFGERAAQIAVEAAKRLAFPMLLLALVFMFLAFHGRVGRKDPKLALAAVDQEHNFLDFE
ncbi:MAG: hypothetical protein ACRDKT_09370 [Actinomycetota bacterium]